MRAVSIILLLFAASLLVPQSGFPTAGQAYRIEIDGVINPASMAFIQESLSQAEEGGAAFLILQLDTPGGLGESMREIVKTMLASKIPVIVYVAPDGARAASAGVFITLAAHVAAMSPGTHIGAAHPVNVGGQAMDEEMSKKVTNDFAAYIRNLAKQKGRNEEWAEQAVRESVSITADEALKLKVIDLIAVSTDELLEKIDGRAVVVDGEEVRLQTKGIAVKELPKGIRYKILDKITNPNVAYILMILGFYGLFFELSNPGAIVPGVVGGICLILAFYAFQSLPVNYAGLLLILLAIILFVAEIKVVSGGVLSIGGVIAMILGSFLLIDRIPEAPYLHISLTVIFTTVAVTALFFLVIIGLAFKVHTKKGVSGPEGMVGEVGRAETDIAPEGRIFLHSETWKARSTEPIEKGAEVVVTAVEGLTVHVRRKSETSPQRSIRTPQ
ncbi:MAG: nodulation protein NfeD [bacterium]|nr:nodulation protein NfeD [bacterium]